MHNIERLTTNKLIDYKDSIKMMEQRIQEIHQGTQNELIWFLNHNHIYTQGTSASNKEIINNTNTPIIKTNRGGKTTYHGPGQRIVYFLLDLNKRKKDVRKLVNKIENCIIDVLNEYKIESYRDKKNIGIWVGDKNNSLKIAAIGIRVKKWIAYHGFALNVSNDLSKYNGIVPCGIKNKGLTSLKELGINNYNNIEKIIINKFLNIFL